CDALLRGCFMANDMVIGSARGGRKPSANQVLAEIVRELDDSDLPTILNPPPVGSSVPTVKELRSAHHQVAQLIAQGVPQVQISLMTGMSQSRISILKTQDPAFQELVSYYQTQKEAIFVDVLERMKSLGIATLDKIQEQLDSNPGSWSKRELMELAELTLLKGRVGVAAGAAGAVGAGAAGVTVNVKFVSGGEAPPPTIEGNIELNARPLRSG